MKELTGPDRLLFDRIVSALKSDGQYVAHFDEDQVEGIQLVRSLGRRAGRHLRWKVTTLASDPDRSASRRVTVYVVVTEDSPLRRQLGQIRMRKAMERFGEGF